MSISSGSLRSVEQRSLTPRRPINKEKDSLGYGPNRDRVLHEVTDPTGWRRPFPQPSTNQSPLSNG